MSAEENFSSTFDIIVTFHILKFYYEHCIVLIQAGLYRYFILFIHILMKSLLVNIKRNINITPNALKS